jgi:transcriptional regulator with GAF, ATPase, and Fis domain
MGVVGTSRLTRPLRGAESPEKAVSAPFLALVELEDALLEHFLSSTRYGSIRPICLPDLPHGPFRALDVALCIAGIGGSVESALPRRARRLLEAFDPAPVVLVAQGTNAGVADSLRRIGVAEVITEARDPGEVVERALAHRPPAKALRPQPSQKSTACRILGVAPSIQELRRQVEAVAATGSSVLLGGETGSGKGLVARVIHDLSSRRDRAFVHVDCAALSPSLIESELFGHERGSFTGADARRFGRFELAHDGTIFLDEVGELAPELQAKLLRVLQDRTYERIGGAKPLTMTARVITATNRDLREAVCRKQFRADLYYRLNVVQLRLPPLRERKEDIPTLVESELGDICRRLGVPTPTYSSGFLEALMAHRWPGNVRELLNVLERTVISARTSELCSIHLTGMLDSEDLSEGDSEAAESDVRAGGSDPGGMAARGYRDEIAETLRVTGGNLARSARRLGIPRSTLRYWIRRFELSHLIPRD